MTSKTRLGLPEQALDLSVLVRESKLVADIFWNETGSVKNLLRSTSEKIENRMNKDEQGSVYILRKVMSHNESSSKRGGAISKKQLAVEAG